MKADSDTLLAMIYDCAVDPALWPETLASIRDSLDVAHVAIGLAETNGRTRWRKCNADWDEQWLERLVALRVRIPNAEHLFNLPVDVSWTALTGMPEQEFKSSQFYREWLKPQNLRDFLSLNYLKRDQSHGTVMMPAAAHCDPIGRDKRHLVERLSPHIRRAVMINDAMREDNLATALYRQVLHRLAMATIVVGPDRKLLFANSAAETLLSAGDKISIKSGMLQAIRNPSALEAALDHALEGDLDIVSSGAGVPLLGGDGSKAAAFVLPLRSADMWAAFGRGCSVVFVNSQFEQCTMTTELLRDLFDFTVAEARIALLIAKGSGPLKISDTLGIKLNTVRTHLKHIYAKADVGDQISLAGCINAMLPPVQ